MSSPAGAEPVSAFLKRAGLLGLGAARKLRR
jgi:hypothetical protein